MDDFVRPQPERLGNRQPQRLILLRTDSCPGDQKEEGEEKQRRPHMPARGLLTRGPPSADPPEAHAKSVPVGKRTALKGSRESRPREGRYKANQPFTLLERTSVRPT